jgi:transposase
MARPLSEDIRERVVAAVAEGMSTRAVAARFGVAVSSIVKWSPRYRATGSVAPMGGHRKRVLEPHRAFIMEPARSDTHLALHGLSRTGRTRGQGLAQCGVAVPILHQCIRPLFGALRSGPPWISERSRTH